MVSGWSIVVVLLPHPPKVKDSSPAETADIGSEKNYENRE
jgi:hypothetical protein